MAQEKGLSKKREKRKTESNDGRNYNHYWIQFAQLIEIVSQKSKRMPPLLKIHCECGVRSVMFLMRLFVSIGLIDCANNISNKPYCIREVHLDVIKNSVK